MAVTGIIKPTVAGTSASPNLGNGGADYNTAESALKKKIAQNQLNIATNKNHVESETSRALKVIQERKLAGQDTTAQQKYLNTNLGYKAPTANTSNTMNTNAVTAPTTAKTNASQGSTLMEQMLAIANREKAEFSYDPNSDPAYQAALKRASANIDTGNSAAQAEMNRRGILNSTITSDRMSEIASAEMGNVETTVIPQLMAQAYQKYQDQQNQEQQQFANMGSLAQMYTGEDQRGIDNTNTTAGLTGYLPGGEEAQGLVNQLMSLKQQAEAQGITAVERTKLSNQANGVRAMLSQMGVDASAYGANVNYNTASQVTPNIRTLAGKESDRADSTLTFNQNYQTNQQKFNEGVTMSTLTGTLPNGTKTTAQQQTELQNLWTVAQQTGTIPDTLATLYGLPKGTQTQAAKEFAQQLAISQQNADTSSSSNTASNENSNFNQLMEIWQATGKAPAGIDGVPVGTAYSSGAAAKATATPVAEDFISYIDKVAVRDEETGGITNADTVEQYILDTPTSDYEKYRMYISQGLGSKWTGPIPQPGE